MKAFHCDACGHLVFFENTRCLHCGHALGFVPERLDLRAWETQPDGGLRILGESAPQRPVAFRLCANGRDHGVCNWLVSGEHATPFCRACALNEVIPDLTVEGNLERWRRLEQAKRRLVYTLLKLNLPLEAAEGTAALRFRFLADPPSGAPHLTGHAGGVITINVAEADDAVREQRRVSLNEPFRTLVGHFRHEVGHYYWDRLVAGSGRQEEFREHFGDERADYAAALQRHYRDGPPPDWATRFVSAYASAHPWEDWAETTAHYFHITDSIETAASFGMTLRPRHPSAPTMTADPRQAARPTASFDAVLAAWFPLTYALNALNRGVGLPDAYPFALSTPAIEKLRFVHEILAGAGERDVAAANAPSAAGNPADAGLTASAS